MDKKSSHTYTAACPYSGNDWIFPIFKEPQTKKSFWSLFFLRGCWQLCPRMHVFLMHKSSLITPHIYSAIKYTKNILQWVCSIRVAERHRWANTNKRSTRTLFGLIRTEAFSESLETPMLNQPFPAKIAAVINVYCAHAMHSNHHREVLTIRKKSISV